MNKELSANSTLSHYRIVSKIGAGGMGEVYLATDTRLNRKVAIKILPASFANDEDRLRRFEQEARATSALNHPNILTVYDIGTHEEAPFIVAELLEGEELRDQLNDGALAPRKAIDYAQQIAAGLAAAHEKGITHRDLKPENLFITTDGRVKILDFGLAKLRPQRIESVGSGVATQKDITDAGTVMGTVGYMSPEQVRGQEADHRSDIFSFGVILHEMLSGERTFKGDSAVEVMNSILKEDPPELSETNAKISPALDKIVRRCLEKKPGLRFQSASDLGFALGTLTTQSGSRLETAAASPAVMERTGKSPVLHRERLTWLAAAALLTVGALVAGIFVGKPIWKTAPPLYQRLTFSRGTIWNARFAPDGQTVVYSARWNGNPIEVFSARAGKTESRSLKLENTDVLAISASNEMAVLRNRQYLGWYVSRGTLARMPVDGSAARDILEEVQEADWSPDGTKLAVVRWVNGQNQLEYPIGKVLYKTSGYISHPRISPKGDLVAFLDHQAQWDNRGWVAVVDLNGKKTVLSGEGSREEGLAWTPAGDEVWFTASKGGEPDGLYAVTLSGLERLVVRMTNPLMLHDISRDGHVLLSSYNESGGIIGLAPGETKERDLSWLDQGQLSDLSPDGKTILFSYGGEGSGINYAVYLRRTDGSPAIRLGDGDSPRLSPDGKWVLTILFTPPQLALLPTGAGEARPLERGAIEHYGRAASWLPDGKRIVFQGREPGHDWRYYLQSIEDGLPQPITPEGTTATSKGIFISPDRRSVIAADAQHQLSFYPVEGGAPHPIPHLESEDEIIGWGSDGRSLYIARTKEMPLRVNRLDLSTGGRELLKEVLPADPAGVFSTNRIFITPDGKGYVYSFRRTLSNLYLVEGLN